MRAAHRDRGARVCRTALILSLLIAVPAIHVLGFWIVLQFFQGLAALSPEAAGAGGVAFWAHVGGFIAGLIIGVFFRGRTAAWAGV